MKSVTLCVLGLLCLVTACSASGGLHGPIQTFCHRKGGAGGHGNAHGSAGHGDGGHGDEGHGDGGHGDGGHGDGHGDGHGGGHGGGGKPFSSLHLELFAVLFPVIMNTFGLWH